MLSPQELLDSLHGPMFCQISPFRDKLGSKLVTLEFHGDGFHRNLEVFKRACDTAGLHFALIYVASRQGEGSHLTLPEFLTVCDYAVDSSEDHQDVLVGIPFNRNTELSKETVSVAEQAGVDGFVLLAPSEDEVVADLLPHYSGVLQSTHRGVLIENWGSFKITPADQVLLLKKHQNFIGIVDSHGDPSYITKAKETFGEAGCVVGGLGELHWSWYMNIGVRCFTSLTAGFAPELSHKMYDDLINRLDENVKKVVSEILDPLFNLLSDSTRPEAEMLITKAAMNTLGLDGGFVKMNAIPVTSLEALGIDRFVREHSEAFIQFG